MTGIFKFEIMFIEVNTENILSAKVIFCIYYCKHYVKNKYLYEENVMCEDVRMIIVQYFRFID